MGKTQVLWNCCNQDVRTSSKVCNFFFTYNTKAVVKVGGEVTVLTLVAALNGENSPGRSW